MLNAVHVDDGGRTGLMIAFRSGFVLDWRDVAHALRVIMLTRWSVCVPYTIDPEETRP